MHVSSYEKEKWLIALGKRVTFTCMIYQNKQMKCSYVKDKTVFSRTEFLVMYFSVSKYLPILTFNFHIVMLSCANINNV